MQSSVPVPTIPAASVQRLLTGSAVASGLLLLVWLGVAGSGVSGLAAQAPAQADSFYHHVDTWSMPDVVWNDGVIPAAIGRDDSGRLYVADIATANVLVYAGDGSLVDSWEAPYLGDGLQGHLPVAIAVDEARQHVHIVWVAYLGTGTGGRGGGAQIPLGVTLSRFNMDGTHVASPIGAAPDGGIAVDPATGRTLVPSGGTVAHIEPDTGAIRATTNVVFTGGASGRLAALSGNRIIVPAADGNSLTIWSYIGANTGVIDLGAGEILDVAALADDHALVLVRPPDADPGHPLIVEVDANTRRVTNRLLVSDLGAPAAPQQSWPWDLAASAAGFSFVTGRTHFEVLSFTHAGAAAGSLTGDLLMEWNPVYQTPEENASPVQALAPAADGRLLALNGGDMAAVAYGQTGTSVVVGRVPRGTIDFAPAGSPRPEDGLDSDLVITTSDDQIMRLPLDSHVIPTWVISCACPLGGRVTTGAGVAYVTRPRSGEAIALDLNSGAAVSTVRLSNAVGLWPADVTLTAGGRLLTADLVTSQIQVWSNPSAPDVSWQAGLLAGPRRLAARTLSDGSRQVGAVMADSYIEIHETEGGNLLSRWRPQLADGSTFPASDIALGADGRVFLSDAAAGVIRVFAPSGGPTPTPVQNPSATPTPSDMSCVITGGKVAGPPVVVLGNTASITLTLAANCPNQTTISGADIVLVIDRSGSMSGSKLGAAKSAARAFVELLDVRYHRAGVVSFADLATLDVGLTDDAGAVVDGIQSLAATGGTNIYEAIVVADDHLALAGRADALPVIVLLSDGQYRGANNPEDAAREARNRGVQIYTIGLGDGADEALLRTIAGSPDRYFFAPSVEELFPVYGEILRQVISSLAGNLVIDDEMSEEVSYVGQSAQPPALEGRERLGWARSLLPSSGITFTYQVRPLVAGRIPTNLRADAQYTDADGVRRTYTFPVPEILVITPTPTATPVPKHLFLPIAYKNQCIEGTAHGDIVILIDTSGSMEGEKLTKAKEAAGTFVDRLNLPHDQAAVIGFAGEAQVAIGFSTDRAAIHDAINALATSPGTRIDSALNAAEFELRFSASRDLANRGVVVLMSDGAHNGTRDEVIRAAETLFGQVVSVYTIGLGGDVDADLLRAIAWRGGYYYAPDVFALDEVYRQIAVRIPCR